MNQHRICGILPQKVPTTGAAAGCLRYKVSATGHRAAGDKLVASLQFDTRVQSITFRARPTQSILFLDEKTVS